MPAPPLLLKRTTVPSRGPKAVARPAYARQMLAVLGAGNPAIEAAFAAVPRSDVLWAAAVDSVVALTAAYPGACMAARRIGPVEKQPTVAYSHIS